MTASEDGLERYPDAAARGGPKRSFDLSHAGGRRSGELPSERWGRAYYMLEGDDLQGLEERRQAPMPERHQPGASMGEANEARRRRRGEGA